MALVSGRATINSLEVLSLLISSYLYALCQALDLRALQSEFMDGLVKIASEEFDVAFPSLPAVKAAALKISLFKTLRDSFDSTSTMDSAPRMEKVAASTTTVLVDFFTRTEVSDQADSASLIMAVPQFRSKLATRLTTLLTNLRRDYLSGARGAAPASPYLNKTRPVYEFVRLTLGIRMHGSENFHRFSNGLGVEDVTIGQNVSLIHEVCFLPSRVPTPVLTRPSGNPRWKDAIRCRRHLRLISMLVSSRSEHMLRPQMTCTTPKTRSKKSLVA